MTRNACRRPRRSSCSNRADDAVPATGQRPDHHLVGFLEVTQNGSRHMPQPTRHPVAFHGRTHGLADDQSDAGTRCRVTAVRAPDMDDDVGLRRAKPVLHCRVKLR